MFEITIKGETLGELGKNMLDMARLYKAYDIYQADDAAREEMQAERKGKTPPKTPAKSEAPDPKVEPELPFIKEYTAADEEDTPPEPMPVGATAVVDAGTGQPVSQIITAEFVDVEPVKQMTMTDVKVAAAKLAAKDTPKLASILKKYNAAKLSEVAPDALGDFAGEVMDALG